MAGVFGGVGQPTILPNQGDGSVGGLSNGLQNLAQALFRRQALKQRQEADALDEERFSRQQKLREDKFGFEKTLEEKKLSNRQKSREERLDFEKTELAAKRAEDNARLLAGSDPEASVFLRARARSIRSGKTPGARSLLNEQFAKKEGFAPRLSADAEQQNEEFKARLETGETVNGVNLGGRTFSEFTTAMQNAGDAISGGGRVRSPAERKARERRPQFTPEEISSKLADLAKEQEDTNKTDKARATSTALIRTIGDLVGTSASPEFVGQLFKEIGEDAGLSPALIDLGLRDINSRSVGSGDDALSAFVLPDISDPNNPDEIMTLNQTAGQIAVQRLQQFEEDDSLINENPDIFDALNAVRETTREISQGENKPFSEEFRDANLQLLSLDNETRNDPKNKNKIAALLARIDVIRRKRNITMARQEENERKQKLRDKPKKERIRGLIDAVTINPEGHAVGTTLRSMFGGFRR